MSNLSEDQREERAYNIFEDLVSKFHIPMQATEIIEHLSSTYEELAENPDAKKQEQWSELKEIMDNLLKVNDLIDCGLLNTTEFMYPIDNFSGVTVRYPARSIEEHNDATTNIRTRRDQIKELLDFLDIEGKENFYNTYAIAERILDIANDFPDFASDYDPECFDNLERFINSIDDLRSVFYADKEHNPRV